VGAEVHAVIPFADTLVALVESLVPPKGSGLTVSAAKLDVPLEGWVVQGREKPIFLASVPHTRWTSGVLPPVQVAHVHVVEVEG
jgi:hypothetical protein